MPIADHTPVMFTTPIECVVFVLAIIGALILIVWDRRTGKGG